MDEKDRNNTDINDLDLGPKLLEQERKKAIEDPDLFIKLLNGKYNNTYNLLINNSLNTKVNPTLTKNKKERKEKNKISINKKVLSTLLIISLTTGLIGGVALANNEQFKQVIVTIEEKKETKEAIDKLIEMAQNNMEDLNLGKWTTNEYGNQKTFILYPNPDENFHENLNIDNPLEAWIYWNAIKNSKNNRDILNMYEKNINYYEYLETEGFTQEKTPLLYDNSEIKFDPFKKEMTEFIKKMIESKTLDTFLIKNFPQKGGTRKL